MTDELPGLEASPVNRVRIGYPWASIGVGLLLAVYLFATSNDDLVTRYAIPPDASRWDYQLLAIALFVAVVFFDAIRFFRRLQAYAVRMAKYEEQVRELLGAKRELQTRAHKYSRHADKLKLFISDRLLEYIEYDERYLHFKSIAAEIRHNGVICYDQVQTVLRAAIAGSEGARQGAYREALERLVYFWDQLDLVTADNIAMHVANKTYECEEHHYQSLLREDGDTAPLSPTFEMRRAVARALGGFVDEPRRLQESLVHAAGTGCYEDARYLVELDDAGALLGNENHVVLLAENLLNNAECYADKGRRRGVHARIAVRLHVADARAVLSVYNPGPHIDAQHAQQIFQLGFSTRRGKEAQGKGLGLFFVNEIVRGFEGTIAFDNVANAADTLSVRLQMADGEVRSEVVEIETRDGLPLCRAARSTLPERSLEWKLPQCVTRVEVSPQSAAATHAFGDFAAEQREELLDPRERALPRWAIRVDNRKQSARVVLTPLDVGGVRFEVRLPTAQARLEASERDEQDADPDDLEALRGRLPEIGQAR